MDVSLYIHNDGPEIVTTNYWDTQHAKRGLFYLSWNASAARILVPETVKDVIEEMKSSKYVIISKEKINNIKDLSVTHGSPHNLIDTIGYEVLFEDESESPFCIHMLLNQTDRIIPKEYQETGFVVSVWTQNGKQLLFPGKYRLVDYLPYLEPWAEH